MKSSSIVSVKKKRAGKGRKKSKADLDGTILEMVLFGHVSVGDEGIKGAGRIQ